MSDEVRPNFAVRAALAELYLGQLESPDPRDRIRAVAFLAALGSDPGQAVPALERMLKDENADVRQAASAAIAGIEAARRRKLEAEAARREAEAARRETVTGRHETEAAWDNSLEARAAARRAEIEAEILERFETRRSIAREAPPLARVVPKMTPRGEEPLSSWFARAYRKFCFSRDDVRKTRDSLRDRDASVWSLVAANALPLAGVFLLGWDAGAVLIIYWGESVIIGVYGLLKVLTCRVPRPVDHLRKIVAIPYFASVYGAFCAVLGTFVVLLTSGIFGGACSIRGLHPSAGGLPDAPEIARLFIQNMVADDGIRLTLAALAIGHGISFVVNHLLRGERSARKPEDWMAEAYTRVLFLHAVIIAFSAPTLLLGSPLVLVVFLTLLKTALDLVMHTKYHARMQETRGAQT